VAQEKADPTAELMQRTYVVAGLPGEHLAAGTTFGVVVYQLPEKLEMKIPEGGGHVALQEKSKGAMLPDSVNDLLVCGDRLYAANGPHGVAAFSIMADGKLEPVGEIATDGAAMGLAAEEGLFFVAEGTMGVSVWNVSDPALPEAVVDIETPGYARDVLVSYEPGVVEGGGRVVAVYVAAGTGGVLRYELLPDMTVVPVARLEGPGDVRALAMSGDSVVFSRGPRGVCATGRMLDEKGLRCAEVKDRARDVAAWGDMVFVADGGAGLMVVDWSNRSKPEVFARRELPSGSLNRLLLLRDGGALRVIGAGDYLGVVVWEWVAHQRPPESGESETRR